MYVIDVYRYNIWFKLEKKSPGEGEILSDFVDCVAHISNQKWCQYLIV